MLYTCHPCMCMYSVYTPILLFLLKVGTRHVLFYKLLPYTTKCAYVCVAFVISRFVYTLNDDHNYINTFYIFAIIFNITLFETLIVALYLLSKMKIYVHLQTFV